MKVVVSHIPAIRHAYNRRLRDKPDLKGVVTVKFAIDEFGKVIFCEVVSSTALDRDLEMAVIRSVKAFSFEKIDKVGDITEVVYPFSFLF
jgi:TonB family protein